MMMGGGGLIDGFAKMILLICVFVALLAGLVGFAANSGLNDAPMDNAEAQVVLADMNWTQQQRQMEAPYIEQQLAANYGLEIAKADQERQILEAQTAAEVAKIEAAQLSYQAGLIDQRQMMLAEHEQAMIAKGLWNQGITNLAVGVGIILTLTLCVIAVLLVFRMVRPVQVAEPANVHRDIWRDPIERRKRIDTLRDIDRRERQRMIWQSSRNDYSNGHHRSGSTATSPNMISDN